MTKAPGSVADTPALSVVIPTFNNVKVLATRLSRGLNCTAILTSKTSCA